jgi:hypothetical protein
MPKTAFILFACIGVIASVAACHGSTSVTPTPVPSFSASPDPTITSAVIKVTILGSPAPHIPVQESTPSSKSSPQPGTTIITSKTGDLGAVKFYKLKPAATYCWVAVLGPSQTSSVCAPWPSWQSGPITIGT